MEIMVTDWIGKTFDSIARFYPMCKSLQKRKLKNKNDYINVYNICMHVNTKWALTFWKIKNRTIDIVLTRMGHFFKILVLLLLKMLFFPFFFFLKIIKYQKFIQIEPPWLSHYLCDVHVFLSVCVFAVIWCASVDFIKIKYVQDIGPIIRNFFFCSGSIPFWC